MKTTFGPVGAEISVYIPFCDTDCGGVVSNVAYLRYVELARMALFSALGMPATDMLESGLFATVVRTEIDYRAPVRLGDMVKVAARLTTVERVRAVCAFDLDAEAPDGTLRRVAEATQTVALVRMPQGRPERIPKEWAGLVSP